MRRVCTRPRHCAARPALSGTDTGDPGAQHQAGAVAEHDPAAFRAIAGLDRDANALTGLGNSLRWAGEFDQALRAYRQALELLPEARV